MMDPLRQLTHDVESRPCCVKPILLVISVCDPSVDRRCLCTLKWWREEKDQNNWVPTLCLSKKKKKIAKFLSIHWNPSRVKYHVIYFDVTEEFTFKQLLAFIAVLQAASVPNLTSRKAQWIRSAGNDFFDIWSWGTGRRNHQSGKGDQEGGQEWISCLKHISSGKNKSRQALPVGYAPK